jgi:hypothetical protein
VSVAGAGYCRPVNFADRTLSAAVLKALMYWPEVAQKRRPKPVDLSVLPPFFNDVLCGLPWWNRAWQVVEVEPAYPCETAGRDARGAPALTEVFVPGLLRGDAGETMPFSARVRFEGDRLIRLQVKVDDVVLGPALTAADRPEPHPFGAVFSRLMDLRGISDTEMAERSSRARATIKGLRSGYLNPHPLLVRMVAEPLAIAEEDLAAIAGLDVVHDPGPTA